MLGYSDSVRDGSSLASDGQIANTSIELQKLEEQLNQGREVGDQVKLIEFSCTDGSVDLFGILSRSWRHIAKRIRYEIRENTSFPPFGKRKEKNRKGPPFTFIRYFLLLPYNRKEKL